MASAWRSTAPAPNVSTISATVVSAVTTSATWAFSAGQLRATIGASGRGGAAGGKREETPPPATRDHFRSRRSARGFARRDRRRAAPHLPESGGEIGPVSDLVAVDAAQVKLDVGHDRAQLGGQAFPPDTGGQMDRRPAVSPSTIVCSSSSSTN